ncbi:UPF0280 family protein [Primorskyibacter marinus]|uniref:UPF0280 family protein n=1 Tax=Primorskyibacter marinus TaxID=1977320 RepID=UPI000E308E2B|nr:UPF0280 family protein [Primorskyibacter marinus]
MSWAETARAHLLPDGRLRLTHGPIDVIVDCDGPGNAIRAAHLRARDAFQPMLAELVAELPRLRAPAGPAPQGDVAKRMHRAVSRFLGVFITPMAAVAGSVADHLLAAVLMPGHGLIRAHVNNGGDIALWTSDAPFRLAICEDPLTRSTGARAEIGPDDEIGGVATSGWRGRSHSLGIADAVTVLARDAATADAAATLIANAVDLPDHPAVTRAPADSLSPDSDLGARLVTADVRPLPLRDRQIALAHGSKLARRYISGGLIAAACLTCQTERVVLGRAVTNPENPSIHGTNSRQKDLTHV